MTICFHYTWFVLTSFNEYRTVFILSVLTIFLPSNWGSLCWQKSFIIFKLKCYDLFIVFLSSIEKKRKGKSLPIWNIYMFIYYKHYKLYPKPDIIVTTELGNSAFSRVWQISLFTSRFIILNSVVCKLTIDWHKFKEMKTFYIISILLYTKDVIDFGGCHANDDNNEHRIRKLKLM